jgi:hypothetical protein
MARAAGTGKNFSANNVTGKRRASDFYETPYSMTEQLLQVVDLSDMNTILEPAAGNGAIVRVLQRAGFNVTAYDQETDFLTEQGHYDCVLTNPPYSLAGQFVLQAKHVARQRIVLLLPLAYLHGKQRYDTIYTDTQFPLREVHVFTRYPLLGDPLRADGKYTTGMMVYAWYVWDRAHVGPPLIRWLDNNAYILNKRDTTQFTGSTEENAGFLR